MNACWSLKSKNHGGFVEMWDNEYNGSGAVYCRNEKYNDRCPMHRWGEEKAITQTTKQKRPLVIM